MPKMLTHSIQVDHYTIRDEEHQGQKHIVVPVAMIVEGIMSGSHGPLLHLADEFGRFVGAWNGIPVTIQHPQEDGIPVTANSPSVIDNQTVGRIYNARMEGPKLMAEAWISIPCIQQVSPSTLALIQSQFPMEVSIGVFTEDELTPGTWNGENYIGIARSHRPDHLALLPGGVGACSVAAGCGLRTNENKEIDDLSSAAEINNLPDSAFAYIEPGGTKDAQGKTIPRSLRHFPVHDAAHARNALARMSESPFGPKAKKKIMAACKKFGIQVSMNEQFSEGGETELAETNVTENITGTDGLGNTTVNKITYTNITVPETLESTTKRLVKEGHFVVQGDQGFRQVMDALQTKLDRMDDDVKFHFLQEVFPDYCIYDVRGRNGPYSGAGLYKRNYTVATDGTIDFSGEPIPVRREVSYVANSQQGGNKIMADEVKKPCCPEKVNVLIANEHTPYQETDREWLSSLDAVRIDQLVVMAEYKEPEKEVTEPEVKDPAPITNEQAVQALREQLKTPEQFIGLLPAEMQEQMTSAYNLHKQKRSELVTAIKAASRFTDDQLKTKTMAELAILVDMARPKEDYSGMSGGGQLNVNVNDADNLLLPPGVIANQEGGK